MDDTLLDIKMPPSLKPLIRWEFDSVLNVEVKEPVVNVEFTSIQKTA
jgi:hypothetical protein